MKQIYVIGNWKSNKTIAEASEWLQQWKCQIKVTVILCVPFTLLYFLKQEIEKLQLPILLGAQDVSPFSQGAYTGAVNAGQLKELCEYVIIGHSERRKYFREDDRVLSQKVIQAKQAGLKIIYCVSDVNMVIPQQVDIVAYEPLKAIGTGQAELPEKVNQVTGEIKKKGFSTVIYGGSVTSENIANYLQQTNIVGVLPGGASLEANSFCKLIQHAAI